MYKAMRNKAVILSTLHGWRPENQTIHDILIRKGHERDNHGNRDKRNRMIKRQMKHSEIYK